MSHGGRRPGSGRKPIAPGQKKLKKQISISTEHHAWLKENFKTVSQGIAALVDEQRRNKMAEFTGDKQTRYEEYCKLYNDAALATATDEGYYYNGHTGANALSLYVDEKHGVNAADNPLAHKALRQAL